MIENKEIELKMLLTKEQFNQLLQNYLPANFIKQTNYYFAAVNNAKNQSIRIREKENKYLFTLKEKHEDYVQEYEKYTNDLSFENDHEIMDILSKRNLVGPYTKIGELTTERYMVIINNQAELCFDINHYNGITDYEIEYEVIQPHNHQETFLNILASANITYQPNPISKVKRCIDTKKEME